MAKNSRRKLLHIFRKRILLACSIYDRTEGLYRQYHELFQSPRLAEILAYCYEMLIGKDR